MDTPRHNDIRSPLITANLFSRIAFWWVLPLINKARKRIVEAQEVYDVPPPEDTTAVWQKLDRQWATEVARHAAGGKASFQRALVKAHGLYYAMAGIFVFIEDAARILQPVIFRWLMEYFSADSDMPLTQALMYAGGLGAAMLLQVVMGPQALKLSNKSSKATTTGHIVDLVATDAQTLDWVVWNLHGVWQGPVHAAVIMWLIYRELGWPVFTGLGVIIIVLPIQICIAKLVAIYRAKNYVQLDRRVGLMGEVISAIRVIKVFCWETAFGQKVQERRRGEMHYMWIYRVWTAILNELYTLNARVLTAVITVVYVFTDNQLSAAKIFPMFAYFNILSESLLNSLPWAIKNYMEVCVSTERLQKFLLLEEKVSQVQHLSLQGNNNCYVVFDHVTAAWDNEGDSTLSDVTFRARKGEVVAIVGQVGVGKSTVLQAVLGEVGVRSGSVSVAGRLSYAAQQPWIFSSTVRNNILFGRPFVEQRYHDVIEATALYQDLHVLRAGDRTRVGERGVTLSGGQKARVALARALYAEADVYLLDDPLSAVDAATGRHLFDKCIRGYLKDKCVILVTHQLQYLAEVDQLVLMKQGCVMATGTYTELVQSGMDVSRLLQPTGDEADVREPDNQTSEELNHDVLHKEASHITPQFAADEDHAVGDVSWRVFVEYLRAGASWPAIAGILFLCVLTQTAYNLGDYWLSVWVDFQNTTNISTSSSSLLHDNGLGGLLHYALSHPSIAAGVYGGTVLLMFVLGLTRSWTFFGTTVRASATLHDRMYTAVTRSPISFFDTNPKGRILNRFTGDISNVDYNVPEYVLGFTQYMFLVLGSMVVIVALDPWTGLTILPVGVALYFIRRYYVRAQIQLQRLCSAGHSPVLGHLSASLEGVQSIRAFQAEDKITKDFDLHYNYYTGCWSCQIGLFCWFQLNNMFLASIYCTAVVFTCLLTKQYLRPGEAGLVLSYVMPMIWYLESALRRSAELEQEMVHTERVLQYTRLPSEAPLESDTAPPTDWPSAGHVVFDHVGLRYQEDGDLMLDNINFEIQPGEKVGVVGRTGAGKSSLLEALLRMREPLGQIRIDGIPTSELGLKDVRNNISIIPQDHVVFAGTIRSNLDPFDELSDDVMWNVLDKAELRPLVEGMNGRLDAQLSEGGSNISVGQRQLFCLARAALRHNRILVLDEATANVDKKTDEIIQASIRQTFEGCTVITIAHRLNTVMDYDRIIVMKAGRVAQFGVPHELLGDRQGELWRMVQQTGAAERQRLTLVAENSYKVRLSVNTTNDDLITL